MSINHFSSDLPETHYWWPQQQHHYHHTMEPSSAKTPPSRPTTTTAAAFWPNSHLYQPISAHNPHNSAAFSFDLNNEEEDEATAIEDERESSARIITKQEEDKEIVPKEPLFEKPLTPSDVGKLNRLVIPKQHAEKYFPLSGGGGGGGNNDSGGEKGLLLSFEDESGKGWRFRYSYWNSSQSYVLTKGWSRFVKEKRLDAGDVVLFERHRLDGDRLFIGWRKRRAGGPSQGGQEGTGAAQAQPATSGGGGGGGGWTRVYFPSGHHPYPQQLQQYHDDGHGHGHGPALPYQPDCLRAAAVLQSQTTAAASANSKRLRLFGVNLECQQQPDHDSETSSEPPTTPEASSTWTQDQAHYQFHSYNPRLHHSYFNHHNHMDINFSRDMNQTGYRQG